MRMVLAQVPGNTPRSRCPTTFFQNQVLCRSMLLIQSNQVRNIPAKMGNMRAQRNGLLRAQAEHSISQPTLGKAHKA